jgi:hypothetical protein
VRGDYRRTFWRMAWPALRAWQIESVIQVGVISHHLIEFTRASLRGAGEASFYSPVVAVETASAGAVKPAPRLA